MSDIEARVKKIIAEQLGVEESQVTNEKAFVADLGADSLARVSIADVIETALARQRRTLHIDDASLGRLASLHELAEYVERHALPPGPVSASTVATR